MADREPGTGQSLDAISASHPADHEELRQLADAEAKQALVNPAGAPAGPDVQAADRADAMRADRLRQSDAVEKARQAIGNPRPVPGEAGPLQQPQPGPTGPEANTEPFRRVDSGNTAPQPALQEADFTTTQPFAQIKEYPPNRMDRQEDVSGEPGYQGKHRLAPGAEPQYPLADTQYKGEHRKTLMGRVRNVLNRLRGRG